jgi:hypothetical protein
LPLDAAVLSVSIIQAYSPINLQLFVACFGYDSFVLIFDVADMSLHFQLILKRYGDYWLTKPVIVRDSYALFKYLASPLNENNRTSRQVVGLYDINTTGLAKQETRYLVGMGLFHDDLFTVHLGLSFKRKEPGRSIYLLTPRTNIVQ